MNASLLRTEIEVDFNARVTNQESALKPQQLLLYPSRSLVLAETPSYITHFSLKELKHRSK